MSTSLHSPQVTATLEALYADAAAQHRQILSAVTDTPPANSREFYSRNRNAYMAVGPEFGRLLYTQARATHARTIVEFGTSFGISTIHLAAALRDNGGGQLITTEYEPEKAEQARQNLTAAGLADLVDFRIGDALQTLADSPTDIDMVFLDGAKELYLPVLRLLEPRLHPGTLIASDNTDHADMADFLTHIRTPANGYTSAALHTEGPNGKAHEITVRI